MNANRALQIALSDRPALINAGHKRIAGLVHSVINESRAVGDVLLGAQKQIPHGGWALWQSSNCPDIAPRTLRGYMQLARHCQDHPEDIKKLEGMSLEGALRRLASPKTAGARQFESEPDSLQHTEAPIPSDAPQLVQSQSADTATPAAADEEMPPLYEPLDEDEIGSIERAEVEYAASIDKVMQADDKMAAAHAEIKRQAAEIKALKISRDGYMQGQGQAVRMLKKEQSKTKRLLREIDSLKARLARAQGSLAPAKPATAASVCARCDDEGCAWCRS